MSPQAIYALGTLLAEAAAAGASIADILDEADKTGKVPPEQWDKVAENAKRAKDKWDAAGR